MWIKLLSIFAVVTVFTFVTYSQGSYLQISLYDDGDFSVTLDNTTLGAGNYAEFDNLPAGEHSLKIVRLTENSSGETAFDGKIKIPSGSDLYAVIDEYNAFMIYKKKKYGFNRYVPTGEQSRKCGDDGVKINKNNESTSNDSECKFKVMKKDDYSDLKKSINNRNFESTNSATLKTAIDNNYFTSEQVVELLRYFTYEDSKLEIAKYIYKKVCDPGNFFKGYEAFDFDSSVQELKNYISGK